MKDTSQLNNTNLKVVVAPKKDEAQSKQTAVTEEHSPEPIKL